MSVTRITSPEQISKLHTGTAVLHFWADWSKQCEQTAGVVKKLAQKFTNIQFADVEAERVPDVTEKYSVLSVPFFVFLKEGAVVDQVEGANIPALSEKVTKYSKEAGNAPAAQPQQQPQETKAAASPSKPTLHVRLEKLVNHAPAMLFMKGTPDNAQCGFSSKMVAMLQEQGIEFSSFNILGDEEVRQGLKEYSNWPTFPQLYINGKLVGGLDIVKELAEQGELKAMVPTIPAKNANPLHEKLEKLINTQPIMLFMKGSPENPQCGFSKKMVGLLEGEDIRFGSFNILSDEEVRQGLKTYSNWPTFPQLYSKGKLVGGLDIVIELQSNGELKDALE